MNKANLTEIQEKLLDRYNQIGGCVDFVAFDIADGIEQAEIHRQAAVAALESIGARWKNYALLASAQRNIPIEKFFVFKIDGEKAASLVGKRISPAEFLGPRCDWETGTLRQADALAEGYAYAFCDPPYGLSDMQVPRRLETSEVSDLFESINRELLGGITSQSIIYQWPVDWSNYFDAGQEWWGSFLWTFANPGFGRLIVLAASSTD
jgi:hypothetical protein